MSVKKRLFRTTGSEKMILGVCGGVSKYFDIDPTIIRVVFAVFTVAGIGTPIIIYLIMGLIMPSEKQL